MIARLARSQARGVRQAELVNELLEGPVAVSKTKVYISMWPGYRMVARYGDTGLSHSSYTSLRNRLVGVGFVLKRTEDEIEMRFTV